MCERGYAILLWYDDSVVGVYTIVRSMERAAALCESLPKELDSSEVNAVSWMPTFIEGE